MLRHIAPLIVKPVDLFDMPAERVVAYGRLTLASVALLAINTDPTRIPHFAAVAPLALVLYWLYAAVLALLLVSRTPSRTIQYAIHAVDIAAVGTLLLLTDGPTSALLVFFTFTILAASLRWNWRAVLVTAGLLVALFLLIGLAESSATADHASGHDFNWILIRCTYLLVAGSMLAYVSAARDRSRNRLASLARWSGLQDHGASERPIEEVLAYTADLLQAPRALLVWSQPEEPFLTLALWDRGHCTQIREPSGAFGDLVASEVADEVLTTVDAMSGTYMCPDGPRRSKYPLLESGLAKRFGIRAAASAPFRGTACSGRVFVLDRTSWNEDHLLLVEIVTSHIGAELDREILRQRLDDATSLRERMRLARDLHDGVLQALAAAGIQLKLLISGLPEEKRTEIGHIQDLLVAEQQRVRRFVQEIRAASGRARAFFIAAELGRLAQEARRKWNCTIALEVWPADASIPRELGSQISLMLAEAASNAVRHGQASHIAVRIAKEDGHLTMTILDNGGGLGGEPASYDADALASRDLGPVSLRERALELGGSLRLSTSPSGLQLEIRLPLR